jgi:trigger factor
VKTNVVEKGQWARELEVEVSADRIESELTRAYQKYQKRMEIPGFRKGRAPLQLIKSRYGDSIRGEVITDLLPTLVQEAAKEVGIVPAAPPRIAKLEHEPGQQLTFTAHLDVWPEIEVEGYEGLEAARLTHEVTDEEIDGQLRSLQERQATETAVERPLRQGDVLIADLQRIDEGGLPIIGEKFDERRFLIGQSEAPSPEFEEALVGISAGETRDVGFAYRADLPNEKLAGTRDRFRVTAREVRERSLPALDDEFAKDLGDRFQSLDELRQHLAGQLRQQWEYMSTQRLRSDLVEQLIRRHPFELPESIVDHFVRSLHEERDHRHGSRHDHEHDEEPEAKEEERRLAERQLRRHLLLEGVRKRAGIEVTDAEFEEHLARRAEEVGVSLENLKRSDRLDTLRRELTEERVFALLRERASLTEEKV